LLEILHGLAVQRFGFGVFSRVVERGGEIGAGKDRFRSVGTFELVAECKLIAAKLLRLRELAFCAMQLGSFANGEGAYFPTKRELVGASRRVLQEAVSVVKPILRPGILSGRERLEPPANQVALAQIKDHCVEESEKEKGEKDGKDFEGELWTRQRRFPMAAESRRMRFY
jgi:hypothetical protein